MAKGRGLPELDELFEAADEHALNAGHYDYAIGDLQEMLRAAWRIMSPTQRRGFFRQPELVALSEIFEYETLIQDLIRDECEIPEDRVSED